MADTPDAPAELTLDDVRRAIRLELIELTTNPDVDLAPMAARASALADAYVRLGGSLDLAPQPAPAPRLNRADVDAVERASAAAWTAASQPDAKPDTIAEAVRETLLGLAR